MKIDWQPNPLYTRIILDDVDCEKLRYAILLNESEEWSGMASYYLKDGERFNLDKARKLLSYFEYDDEDQLPIEKRVNELYRHYLSEMDGAHCGDCICVPASCSKCFAEGMLSVNTIKGAGKHSLYKIDAAFDKKNDGSVSIDHAIYRLKNYEPKAEWEGWEAHADRWRAEADRAATWLQEYKETHFA